MYACTLLHISSRNTRLANNRRIRVFKYLNFTRSLFIVSTPQTSRRGFMPSSVTSLHIMYSPVTSTQTSPCKNSHNWWHDKRWYKLSTLVNKAGVKFRPLYPACALYSCFQRVWCTFTGGWEWKISKLAITPYTGDLFSARGECVHLRGDVAHWLQWSVREARRRACVLAAIVNNRWPVQSECRPRPWVGVVVHADLTTSAPLYNVIEAGWTSSLRRMDIWLRCTSQFISLKSWTIRHRPSTVTFCAWLPFKVHWNANDRKIKIAGRERYSVDDRTSRWMIDAETTSDVI